VTKPRIRNCSRGHADNRCDHVVPERNAREAAARNIPITELNSRLTELGGLEGSPIVLVCRTDKRSAAAARTLRAAGFSQVNVLRQGMERWNEAGLPVADRIVRS
jgi:rhodanese-related sulfurtransferase